MNALTWIIEVAGKIFPKNSPCARPTFSESAALIMYIRVRTTSANPAPACSSARSIFFSVCTACAYASPTPTIFPCASVAVVPDTHTFAPTRTAREYPITGSQGVPLEKFVRAIKFLPAKFRPNHFHRTRIPFSIFAFPFSVALRIKSRPQLRRHNRTQILALAKHSVTNPRHKVVSQIKQPARHNAQYPRQHPPPATQSPKNMQKRRRPHQQFPITRQNHHAIRQSRPSIRRNPRNKRRALQGRKPKRPPFTIVPQNKLHRPMTQPAMSIAKKIFRRRRASRHQKSIARAPHTPAPAAAHAARPTNRNHTIATTETPPPSRLPPFPKISKLVQSANLCRS